MNIFQESLLSIATPTTLPGGGGADGQIITSWHPIQTSSSEDLWELPTQVTNRSYATDEDHADLSSVTSFQSVQSNRSSYNNNNNNNDAGRQQREAESSLSSPSSRQTKQRKVLGDRTNNAPILLLRRSHFR